MSTAANLEVYGEEPSAKRLQEDVEHIKEWLSNQPHLPNITDDKWLITFISVCKFSLEKTKLKLDGYYSCRSKYPRYLKNRDPYAREIIQAREAYNTIVSSFRSKSGVRLIVLQPSTVTDFFVPEDVWKRSLMIVDTLYLEEDHRTKVVVVFDCANVRHTHCLKTLPTISIGADIIVKAYRISGMSFNVINAPPFLGPVVSAFKSCYPSKIANRIHIHRDTSELLEYVDEDVLCKEFGGKGPSLKEYDEYTVGVLEKYATWFAEQESICSNEQLRRPESNSFEEMQGSFRKLEVD